ncbi:MarR family transcriptional regulator [Kitasatospora xanthocidica]|uniref:MarR family transcriptional regulator n=1 Tax=Kitasatospora xanthocidica TaxID=83382 RepID=A0A372ZMX2_9ACTN|nr:MarR family transcriptional regulator [Kitasatospora xanthocidica]RGD56822.1 MarR family transcriptional regulator [Kitasatospora xanthocidica]
MPAEVPEPAETPGFPEAPDSVKASDSPEAREPGEPRPDLLAALTRISRLSAALTRGRLVERAVEEAGLGRDRPAVGVLVTLRTADGPLRIGEIADRMQVVGPHITRQVQILEKHGLARRIPDPYDARARLIEPTEAGAEAVNRYLAFLLGWFTDALGDWPRQDRDDLVRLLARFADDVTTRLARLDEEE